MNKAIDGNARYRLSPERALLINALSPEEVAFALKQKQEHGNLFAASLSSYPTLVKEQRLWPSPHLTGNPDNVLTIGDTHAPFTKEEYLEFCLDTQKRYDCGKVVHIGDLMDFCAISRHPKDPDGLSAGSELDAAEEVLDKIYHMFPNVVCTRGNHDNRIWHRAQEAGLSRRMVKPLEEVLRSPKGWTFTDDIEIDGVVYQHGTMDAYKYMRDHGVSVVQGHLHTLSYVQYISRRNTSNFAMQVGGGFDAEAYALAYAKPNPKLGIMSCGVVLDKGRVPFTVLM